MGKDIFRMYGAAAALDARHHEHDEAAWYAMNAAGWLRRARQEAIHLRNKKEEETIRLSRGVLAINHGDCS